MISYAGESSQDAAKILLKSQGRPARGFHVPAPWSHLSRWSSSALKTAWRDTPRRRPRRHSLPNPARTNACTTVCQPRNRGWRWRDSTMEQSVRRSQSTSPIWTWRWWHTSMDDLLARRRGVISNFSWGAKILFLFFNATGLLKNWKKQHFICSKLKSFIVPFFLFLFFSLFSFFFSFFFSFSLGGATAPPAP